MGFFDKLKQGLTKTKESINDKINNVFSNFRKVDEELLESFEKVFENNEFRDKVCKICENCWNNNLDSNDYNYKGELI